MHLLPQEVEVWYILPAIRKEFTEVMMKQGFKQKHIAKILGVTEAAVSQYKNSKRAGQVSLTPKMKEIVEKISLDIRSDCKIDEVKRAEEISCDHYNGIYKEFQKLLKVAREERVICMVHKHLGYPMEDCQICLDIHGITEEK
jgi:hypothetical protein